MPQEWWIEVQKACRVHHVNPYFAGGVMAIESRFKLYKSKKWIPPMNLAKCFEKKFHVNLHNIKNNINYGVRALKPRGKERNEVDVLHRYNAKCNKAYIKAVMMVKRQAMKRNQEQVKLFIPKIQRRIYGRLGEALGKTGFY